MGLTIKEPEPGEPKLPMIMRVWHIPQIPGKAFHVRVFTLAEAKNVMRILANYDKFQLDNRIKGDYANVQGLEAFYDGPEYQNDGEGPRYMEWDDEETGEDIHEWIARNLPD